MTYEYIDKPEGLARAIDRIRAAPVLGVDTEAAGFHRFHDRITLLQISSRGENLIIDPLALEDLSALGPIFLDPGIEKVFHDADFDLRILFRDLQLEIRNLFDTQVAAAFLGERSLGLSAVAQKYLGVALPKAYQRADWAERPLGDGMLQYAATDTAFLPDLRDRLLDELEKRGRVEWAREEFARKEATRWVDSNDAENAFLRIKGARDLTPRGLAILREVHRWRDEVGRERDQATFRILPNEAMIEIAAKAPTTRAGILGIGSLPNTIAERRWRELTAAVQRGLQVPESELPRFPPSRRWERDPAAEERADRLRTTRNRIAEQLDLDPGFLMSRALLEEIARVNPTSIEELARVPDVRRWQVEVLGSDLLRTLRGEEVRRG